MSKLCFNIATVIAVADPAFPNPWGRQPIIWAIYPDNFMKMKKFWAGGSPSHPLDPPMYCAVS